MASSDDIETNTKFAEKNNAKFPILSDSDKSVANQYGVIASHGFPDRWTFYIGGDGKILAIDKSVNPQTAGSDIVKTLVDLGVVDDA